MMNEPYYPFVRWSTEHWLALAITLLVTAALLLITRKFTTTGRSVTCKIMAGLVALQFISEYVWRICTDTYGSWQYNLPLHIFFIEVSV